MRNKLFAALLVVVVFPQSVLAQNDYSFSQFWKETGVFFTQPLRWQGDDWLTVGAVGAATGLATLLDQSTRTMVQKDNGRYFYSVPIVAGRVYGELYTPIGLFAGFAGYSLITGDQKARKIAFELGQAALYGGGFVFLAKILVGRARPLTNEGPGHFRPSFSIVVDDYHSFPSGHTAVAFVISTILSRNVEPLWAKILCYAPALLTPISRVYQDEHWVSDVVMGGAIGYFFGKWVVDQHERNDDPSKDKSAVQITSFFPLSVSIALN